MYTLHDQTFVESHTGNTPHLLRYLDGSMQQLALPYYTTVCGNSEDPVTDVVVDVAAALPTEDDGCDVIYSHTDFSANETTYYRENYDAEGNCTGGDALPLELGAGQTLDRLLPLADGTYAAILLDDSMGSFFSLFDADFTQTSEWELHVQWVDSFALAPDGTLYLSYYGLDGFPETARVDTAAQILHPLEGEDIPDHYTGAGVLPDGSPCLFDGNGLYAVRGGVCEKVIDWANSDFVGGDVTKALPLADGTFLISAYDGSYEHQSLWQLTARKPEELANLQIITMSMLYQNPNLIRAVTTFNRARTDVRIVMQNYGIRSEDYQQAKAAFERDLLDGKLGDIIVTGELPFENYADKGLFLDLYPLLAETPAFQPEDYFMNYFTSLETEGKLLRFSNAFQITTLAAKTKHLDGREHLTLAETTALLDSLPAGMEGFHRASDEDILRQLIMQNLGAFVDVKGETCDFENDAFMGILEYAGRFPSVAEMQQEQETWTDAQHMEYIRDYENCMREDRVLFRNFYLTQVEDYAHLKVTFGKDAVTLVGFPTLGEVSGNGGVFTACDTIAVHAETPYQPEIAAFLMHLLSEEQQRQLPMGMPVRRSVLHEQQAEVMAWEPYLVDVGGTYEEIAPATAEEMEAMEAYIAGVTVCDYVDETVYGIVYEEAGMYFAGDQTVQSAVEHIQSRVELYLAE